MTPPQYPAGPYEPEPTLNPAQRSLLLRRRVLRKGFDGSARRLSRDRHVMAKVVGPPMRLIPVGGAQSVKVARAVKTAKVATPPVTPRSKPRPSSARSRNVSVASARSAASAPNGAATATIRRPSRPRRKASLPAPSRSLRSPQWPQSPPPKLQVPLWLRARPTPNAVAAAVAVVVAAGATRKVAMPTSPPRANWKSANGPKWPPKPFSLKPLRQSPPQSHSRPSK